MQMGDWSAGYYIALGPFHTIPIFAHATAVFFFLTSLGAGSHASGASHEQEGKSLFRRLGSKDDLNDTADLFAHLRITG